MLTNEERNLRLDKWIAALRSGAYKQGTGEFHIHNQFHDKHCCLGVAELVGGYETISLDDYSSLRTFYGLIESQTESLYKLNDSEKEDFFEIADYIEHKIKDKEVQNDTN